MSAMLADAVDTVCSVVNIGERRALQPIYRPATADELVSRSLVERRFILALLGAFATLAGVGDWDHGVMSVATAQRTREFGVRLALGAERRAILGMVFKQAPR